MSPARVSFLVTLVATAAMITTGALFATVHADKAPRNKASKTKKAKKQPALKKVGPVTCTDDAVVLRHVHIETDGVAVTSSGACDVIIEDSVVSGGAAALRVDASGDIRVSRSTVTAARTAAHVQGSGDIVFNGSQVTGGKYAFVIIGSGNVSVKDTELSGEKRIRGSGEYLNRGGNTWK
jgi:hypothetical protein